MSNITTTKVGHGWSPDVAIAHVGMLSQAVTEGDVLTALRDAAGALNALPLYVRCDDPIAFDLYIEARNQCDSLLERLCRMRLALADVFPAGFSRDVARAGVALVRLKEAWPKASRGVAAVGKAGPWAEGATR